MNTTNAIRSILFLLAAGFATVATAQSHTRFNYQAQLRDASDLVLADQSVSLRIAIRAGSSTGPDVYREVHSVTTTSIGLVNVLVGAGTVEFGDIDVIAWGDTTYYLKLDADFGGGFTDMGSAPIASVPISVYARNSGTSYWHMSPDSLLYYSDSDIGIGRSDPNYALDMIGVMRIRNSGGAKLILEPETDANNARIIIRNELSEDVWWAEFLDRTADDRIAFKSFNGGGTVLSMYHDGRTAVKCLEILGGCDINERFNSTELLEAGSVVIADPDRPGEVRMTNEPYDGRVLGVISGANGINPGLTLKQEQVLDGAHPVALSGRIYVKVVGPVKVGDLLTTSTEPGKAMVASDRERAFGSVIGKALDGDADGDGYVLMLVQPR